MTTGGAPRREGPVALSALFDEALQHLQPAQRTAAEASKAAYQAALKARGYGPITTEVQSRFFGIVQGELEDRYGWLEYVEG